MVPAGAATRFHQGHRERVADIARSPRPRFFLDHHPHVGDSEVGAEAADNGLLAPELAAGISRVRSAKTQGIRTGNWLSQRQAQALLSAPDITTLRGLRDRAILAVLLGCGLRRSELVGLKAQDFQIREE